jgi:hypothetical protein
VSAALTGWVPARACLPTPPFTAAHFPLARLLYTLADVHRLILGGRRTAVRVPAGSATQDAASAHGRTAR